MHSAGTISGSKKRQGTAKPIFALLFMMSLGMVAAASLAVAQTPKITSISAVSAQQYQTIRITGSGFGTQQPYIGDSPYISFEAPNWGAGYSDNAVTLIVNSWEDSQIVLGGFSGAYGQGDFYLSYAEKVSILVFNPQSGLGPSTKHATVKAEVTGTSLMSSPNPSSQGQSVTFTATVESSGGTPADGEAVSFIEGTTTLGTGTLSAGTATFTTSTLPVGKSVVKAVYAGDKIFKASKSKPVKQVVQ